MKKCFLEEFDPHFYPKLDSNKDNKNNKKKLRILFPNSKYC